MEKVLPPAIKRGLPVMLLQGAALPSAELKARGVD